MSSIRDVSASIVWGSFASPAVEALKLCHAVMHGYESRVVTYMEIVNFSHKHITYMV